MRRLGAVQIDADGAMIGMRYPYELNIVGDAKTTLRSFIRRFPDSPLINDARMALADISIKH